MPFQKGNALGKKFDKRSQSANAFNRSLAKALGFKTLSQQSALVKLADIITRSVDRPRFQKRFEETFIEESEKNPVAALKSVLFLMPFATVSIKDNGVGSISVTGAMVSSILGDKMAQPKHVDESEPTKNDACMDIKCTDDVGDRDQTDNVSRPDDTTCSGGGQT